MQREYTCAQCGRPFAPRRPTRRYCSVQCSTERNRRPLAIRFWEKVRKTEGCWLWTAARLPSGYGVIGNGVERGAMAYAHRVAYELSKGPIPQGYFVCHTCDNPPCVNPDHLFAAPPSGNHADMDGKGRGFVPRLTGDQHPARLHPERLARGEKSGRARLTEAAVRDIRTRHADNGISGAALAREFGVSKRTVLLILRRETWAHIQP